MGSSLRVGPLVILTAGVLVAILRGIRGAPTLRRRGEVLPLEGGEVLHRDVDIPESLPFEGQVEGTGFP